MRTSRIVSLVLAAAMLPMAWATLELSTGPSPSAAAALTPEQQMCASPAVGSTTVHLGDMPDLASCSLDVATTGTAYITASASIYPRSTTQAPRPDVEGAIEVDGSIDVATGRDVALGLFTSDGADRNLSTQGATHLGPGHHVFALHFTLLTGSQVEVLHPVIEVLFVPTSGGAITACHFGDSSTATLADGGTKKVAQCSVHASTSGTLRLSGSAELSTSTPNRIAAELIASIDGSAASQTHVEGSTAGQDVSPMAVTHQAATHLTAGDHDVSFTVQASGGAAFTVESPSVQAVFTPDGSADVASCVHAADAPSTTSGSVRLDSCTLTLPRPGRVQIQAATTLALLVDAQNRTSDVAYYFWLVVDGVDQSSTSGRYMDLRTFVTGGAETVLTHLGLDLPAGAHSVELWMRHISGTLTASSAAKSSIAAIAVTQPADAPPATAPPTTVGGGNQPAPQDFVPLVPERLLDTRGHNPVGYIGDKPTAGQTIALRVTGVGASNVPPDAKAVVLNLTGTASTADGYVTVWPCGSPQPAASNLNTTAGASVPNLVIAKVGTAGTVCLFTQASQDLVADIAGYMPAGSAYVPLVPDRILDTRRADQRGYTGPKPGPGAVIALDVTGAGSSQVPDDATAVVLNVTATEAEAPGYVTVWPCGSPQPTASNLNLAAGVDRPNLVVSKIGDGGQVCLFTQSSSHLVADVNGYLPSGSSYVPIVPLRILETRPPAQLGFSGEKPGAGAVVRVHVTGDGAAPATAAAVVLNVTGTEASADGYVTVWPCGAEQPTASNLNLTAGSTSPNLVMSKVGTGGDVCLYTQSGTHLLADLDGYWAGASG